MPATTGERPWHRPRSAACCPPPRSETERHYTYSIIEAPFPVTGYLSSLRVHSIPGREDACEVQWSGSFTPAGVSDSEAVALFTTIFRDGLDALHDSLTA
ncbi:SRPBCC family protein [Nonomuraea sp. NPDC005692]|uniref:SRPBCC family protein n=1 Tax=Nonomuraea sp. NPDC005692 TaxID=3157168 RepID=UPI0034086428